MPAPASSSQPDPKPGSLPSSTWFAGVAGRAVLESEEEIVLQAGVERPGQPWLWLAVGSALAKAGAHGVALHMDGDRFDGAVRCALPLPIASEAVGTVVLQHVGDVCADPATLLAECTRVLLPGGRLWLLALNPLAPYRWRWSGNGVRGWEPVSWRRRLRTAGLVPEVVSQGVGPRWRIAPSPGLQDGAGLRAAYLLRAEKRVSPLTPTRARPSLRLQTGVPVA
jgi:SAM-dependent methyltransferase